MLIKMKLVSYERYVRVHDGVQELTLAHGQEMDISAPGGKIVITGPAEKVEAEAVKTNVEATDSVDTISGHVARPRVSRKASDE